MCEASRRAAVTACERARAKLALSLPLLVVMVVTVVVQVALVQLRQMPF